MPSIAFSFADCFFVIRGFFSLMYSYFFILASLVCFWCYTKKIIAKTNVKELFPYVYFKKFYSFRSYVYFFNLFQLNFIYIVK